MQLVGGTPAPLSWIAETVLGARGALRVEAAALRLSGRCFCPCGTSARRWTSLRCARSRYARARDDSWAWAVDGG
jgi:hypothetical protein